MKFYDVTAPIFEGMPVYKNKTEKQPKLTSVTNDYVTESRIDMDVHTGTHIDAPLHMVKGGDTFETISLDRLVGPCKLFDLTHVNDKITKDDIAALDIQENDFVLFKTKNSLEDAFNFEFIYVAEDAARYLADQKVRGVGIDALGIERSQQGHPTHKTLFSAGVIVIEGLRLKDVPEGSYFMVAAPLKLVGTDAAPARVLLFTESL
ncbi:cyclase family protein [Saccharococcus thermophilus]|uniref:Kynurenine formamidase n=1 Tax=Saccharococcus thermophilus TaxID=29396 RepID=A0A846MI76_9BACL|nr:cyclase family protein [Saccharococcus thermophilus]NIK14059.1 arylformamidase [Saccharococcus thermophilus]NIK15244.1 arylformamidase [Saccharococcus thermophilus]